ncbi:MAG: HvfA family oxazolone/thioamide-modified RiPP metallophore [Nocardioidaceae bacterium]
MRRSASLPARREGRCGAGRCGAGQVR